MRILKERAHTIHPYLLNPVHQVSVNLIGAGGTGSNMLQELGRLHTILQGLDHPGLFVRVFDGDEVSPANLGRQLFTEGMIGMNKTSALVTYINRSYNTNWKAYDYPYDQSNAFRMKDVRHANITITCVDTVEARFEIAELFKTAKQQREDHAKPYYWLDMGNSRHTGQFMLSTLSTIHQNTSRKYTLVNDLPLFTEEYRDALLAEAGKPNTPSCSIAAAVRQQNPFINSTLATLSGALLMQMFTEGSIRHRGAFVNLSSFKTTPVSV